MKGKLLIVDDMEINRAVLREILTGDYEILEAADGQQALELLAGAVEMPQAMLVDILMPEMDGFEVLKRLKEDPNTEKIPVLFITSAEGQEQEARGWQQGGAVDYITRPFRAEVVKARVNNHIQLMNYRANLEMMVEEKTREVARTHQTILETLATIIEYRSLESGGHVRRTGELTRVLIQAMHRDPRFRDQLERENYRAMRKASSLHDIGKVGIPDSILLKAGPLTDEEFAVVKQHTIIGSNIIDRIAAKVSDDEQYLRHCRDICRHHHERWDGNGYPDGLKGEEIPLSARILAVIDVYDALVNKRCYKPAYSHQEAVQILRDGAGTQFDPRIVEILLPYQGLFALLEEELADPE